MNAPWKGKLRVERWKPDLPQIVDERLSVVAQRLTPVQAHALVHRANAYEGLVEALRPFAEAAALIAPNESDRTIWLDGDTAEGGYRKITTRHIRDARRTLDSLEESDDVD